MSARIFSAVYSYFGIPLGHVASSGLIGNRESCKTQARSAAFTTGGRRGGVCARRPTPLPRIASRRETMQRLCLIESDTIECDHASPHLPFRACRRHGRTTAIAAYAERAVAALRQVPHRFHRLLSARAGRNAADTAS